MKSSGIGGQAVLEGVMMRNRDKYAVAVRKPDGEISVQNWNTGSVRDKHILLRLPVIRGVVAFIESLILGIKTLTYSSSFIEEDDGKAEQVADAEVSDRKDMLENILIVALSILLAIGFFMILPFAVSELFRGKVQSQTMISVIEGVLKVLLFLGYVVAISFLSDIKRTFMYHGAEHKTINCVENGLDLTVENVKKQSRYHRRCGTSFLLVVVIISIIFFLFIRFDNLWLRMLYRIILIPVVAGVSFELIQFVGNSDNKLVLLLSKPGLWLQKLTTREPDDEMIEVAIASVEAVFDWRAYQAELQKEMARRARRRKKKEQRRQQETENQEKPETEEIAETESVEAWKEPELEDKADAEAVDGWKEPELEDKADAEAVDGWKEPESEGELAAEPVDSWKEPETEGEPVAEPVDSWKKSATELENRTEDGGNLTAEPKKETDTETAKPQKNKKKAKSAKTADSKEKPEKATEAEPQKKPERAIEAEPQKEPERAERRAPKKKPAKKSSGSSIFDRLPKSKKRRELEAREERYRNRAAERMRQIKEQEAREAAHEKAYQEAKKRRAERLAATQELPKLDEGRMAAPKVTVEQDADDLKSLDRFFDEKK